MNIKGLHHYTIRCDTEELGLLEAFYTGVLGLQIGARPELRFSGRWLYADGSPIAHLYASGKIPNAGNTAIDHIAFAASELVKTRQYLCAHDVPFTEAPVVGFPLHQVFVYDPVGTKLELTFDLNTEEVTP